MHRTERDALRARLADMAERHPSATVRDVCREALDELDALRPLAVLAARVLEAYREAETVEELGQFVQDRLLQSGVCTLSGDCATPHIAATVARLTNGGV